MSTDLIQQLNAEMADVVANIKQSIVLVSNHGHSHGAGIIIEPDGLILTNAHVIRDSSIQVILPGGQIVPARVVAYDRDCDLAALRVDAGNLSAVTLGDSDRVLPGEWVFAVGHPWGVPGAVTSGIAISGGGVSKSSDTSNEWLAANLHLRPGNSGGPLVDIQGRLLGINTVMAGPEVGLAISVDVVKAFLEKYKVEIRSSQPPTEHRRNDTPTIIV